MSGSGVLAYFQADVDTSKIRAEENRSGIRNKKKTNKKRLYDLFSTYKVDEDTNNKPSREWIRAEHKNVCIPVSGLPFHQSVFQSERNAAQLLAAWVKQDRYVHSYCCKASLSAKTHKEMD